MKNSTVATKNNVIILTGIGDNVGIMRLLVHHWKKHGFQVTVFRSGWDDSETIGQKINRLLRGREAPVSLVGVSAGGSLAVNACIGNPWIHKIITVGSRLRGSFPNRAYQDSMHYFEHHEHLITDRRKIMTIRARYGDQLVPPETATIRGAVNITVPCFEHRLTIAATLLWFYQPMLNLSRKIKPVMLLQAMFHTVWPFFDFQ